MKKKLVTLSSSGWVEEITEKADRLLAYFFVSHHSQSTIYPDEVKSLPYILQRFSKARTLEDELQSRLSEYLQPFFDESEVNVIVDKQENGLLAITVDIVVREAGKEFQFSKLIDVSDGKVKRIIDKSNEG